LGEVDAADVERLDVYNKVDLLSPGEIDRLRASHPAALYVSASRGDGLQELLETVASRLALDVRRVRLEFDASSEDGREQIARLYRHARVLQHVAQNGRVSIVAEVPRRLLPRLSAVNVSSAS
jgi:50S ribosomal subunit-associated GTPase HflX